MKTFLIDYRLPDGVKTLRWLRLLRQPRPSRYSAPPVATAGLGSCSRSLILWLFRKGLGNMQKRFLIVGCL